MSDSKAVRLAEDPWRVFKIMAEFVDSFDTLSHLDAAVTVFGSARTKPDDPYYKATVTLTEGLARQGIATVTGGGPGIMEAANRGATHFYAASTNVTNGLERQGDTMVPTSKTQVRFVLFRLEADAWDRMPANLRPETPVKTVASR